MYKQLKIKILCISILIIDYSTRIATFIQNGFKKRLFNTFK